MQNQEMCPETLIAVPNEFEAAMIVSALAAHDIDASTSGSYTSGFRAEAPGDVHVLVRGRDLERARHALEEFSPQPADHSTPSQASLPINPTARMQNWQIVGLLAFLTAAVLYLWR